MVFPATVLDLRTELLLGGTWTDITAGNYVYQRSGPAVITRGRPDESSQASPSSAVLELNNRDGRFSPRNPLGAYYGLIGRNTPLRISVPQGSTYLKTDDPNGSASCPDSVGVSITGDTEIQLDLWMSDYTSKRLAYKWGAVGQQSWLIQLQGNGTVQFFWSSDGSNIPSATSTMPVPAAGRFALKVTLSVATGLVTFYTAPNIGGSWTQLGSPVFNVFGAGATSVFDSTAPVVVGSTTGPIGSIYAFKLLSGIGGVVKASPDFTIQAAGAGSFADAQANTWTVAAPGVLTDRKYRFYGEVPAWPPRSDPSAIDVYTQIAAAGILRRLSQGKKPLQSAMRRGYTKLTGSLAPIGYWPCEDTSGSIASALGGPQMKLLGSPTFATYTGFACSSPLPLLSKSAWYGYLPQYTQTGNGSIMRFLMHVPATGAVDQSVIARMYTRGTIAILDLQYGAAGGGGLQLVGRDVNWGVLFTTGFIAFAVNGKLLRVSMDLKTNGTGVDANIQTLLVGDTAASASGITQPLASVGSVWAAIFNPQQTIDDTAIGHVSVQQVWDTLFDLASPLSAWSGETAGNRFVRLCGEEAIPVCAAGPPADTVPMGAQLPLKILDLLQECEDADRGAIFEPRGSLALGYRTRASMLNQAAAATLSYTHADLAGTLEPQDDDQRTVNDVTVQRTGGSSSHQALSTGALSTQAPPAGVGVYDTSLTVNLARDNQIDDEAGWILHMGTVDEPRYPVISADLARPEVTSLLTALQDASIGDRLDVTSPPPWLPPGSIKQILAGVTERLGGYIFTEAWNCIPESPWETGIVNDPVLGHADTDGSTLHAGITSGATSMTVDTTAATSPLWTTAGGDFPFDIQMGGEVLTVTNITGASSPQTFTVTRSVNGVVKAHLTGEDVRLAHPAAISL